MPEITDNEYKRIYYLWKNKGPIGTESHAEFIIYFEYLQRKYKLDPAMSCRIDNGFDNTHIIRDESYAKEVRYCPVCHKSYTGAGDIFECIEIDCL